jgi:hypothetical protein
VLRLRIAFPTAAPSEHPGGFFDLEAALVAPLDRYEVTLLGHEVYRPPPLTVALAIGIGAYAL